MSVVTRAMKVEKAIAQNPQLDINSELNKLEGPSAKVRYLTALGWERGAIAKILDIRYQHVRNVQLNPLKKK